MNATSSRIFSLSLLAVIGSSSVALADLIDELVAAAKKEGQLTVIGLPRAWCNYGNLIDGFKSKYGLTVNELTPNGGAGDVLETIKANKGNTGSQAPDVIDQGLSFGVLAKKDGLLLPYKVSTWASIPDNVKDKDGYWYGDYYGVMSFVVNTDIIKKVPTDWPDLLTGDYKNSVALPADPRTATSAFNAVFAAGLSAANGKIDNAGEAGLEYFVTLTKAGNFVPIMGRNAGTMAQGATPIVIVWDYVGLTTRDTLKGNPSVQVVVPKTGVLAGHYAQAISAFAPHPNAAKLWEEYLYSDEGQLGWLAGYCHPARFKDLAANNKLPTDLMAKMPPAAAYDAAVSPSLEQQGAARATISQKWDSVVGVNVQ